MTLPSAGNPISLRQVNVELDLTATAAISMGSSAVRGLFGTSSGAIDMSDGYGKSSESFIAASGGSTSTSSGYKYHVFTSSGTFTVNTIGSSTDSNSLEYLVVAGGAAGGNNHAGGGGGAGGYRTGDAGAVAQNYQVIIGAGGSSSQNSGGSGVNSSGFGLT